MINGTYVLYCLLILWTCLGTWVYTEDNLLKNPIRTLLIGGPTIWSILIITWVYSLLDFIFNKNKGDL